MNDEGFTIQNEDAACAIAVSAEHDFNVSTTDAFDPPPRPRVKLTQHHFTADITEPVAECTWVTVVRPYRADQDAPEFQILRDPSTNVTTVSGIVNGKDVRITVDPNRGTIRAQFHDQDGTTSEDWTSFPHASPHG